MKSHSTLKDHSVSCADIAASGVTGSILFRVLIYIMVIITADIPQLTGNTIISEKKV